MAAGTFDVTRDARLTVGQPFDDATEPLATVDRRLQLDLGLVADPILEVARAHQRTIDAGRGNFEPVGAGAAEFFFLDTTLLALAARDPSAATADQVQLDWLDTALSASTARWRIVVGHHPVFSGGRHGTSAPLVRRLKPLLDRHKVHAYFNGHDHDMQHIVVDGVHYLTTGSGSKTRSTQAIAGTLFAASALGFMDVEATDEALTFAFVDDSGAVVHRAAIPAGAG